MSEYGKIETLYERDLSTFKVRVGELKNRTYGLLKTWHARRWTLTRTPCCKCLQVRP
jgi:hypothetical protein